MYIMVGRIMPPQPHIYTVILRNYEYDTLHGKRDFADVSKLSI